MGSVTLLEISIPAHWTCQNDDVWLKVDVYHHFEKNLGYLNVLPFLVCLISVHWNIGRKLHPLESIFSSNKIFIFILPHNPSNKVFFVFCVERNPSNKLVANLNWKWMWGGPHENPTHYGSPSRKAACKTSVRKSEMCVK